MEARLFLVVAAVVAAFACLFAGAHVAAASFSKRRASMAAQGDANGVWGLVKWRLRNGFGPISPLAHKLSANRRVALVADEVVAACAAREITATREAVISVALVALAAMALIVALVTGSAIGAVAVCICLIVVAHVLAGSSREKRREAVREAVPGALESMAACFGSGFTLLQTFNQVAQDAPGYLGQTFKRSAHILETGGSARQALDELREGRYADDLAFVSIALDVQHQSGGSMRQVLDAASDSVKGELALRRSLRVQTAQAKLSARIVVVMPFILVALFSLVSPDFLAPFFSSALGYALLALAIVMQVAGVILVNRALTIDGVS